MVGRGRRDRRRRNRAQRLLRASAWSPLKGSSMRMASGCRAKHRASAARFFIPPESFLRPSRFGPRKPDLRQERPGNPKRLPARSSPVHKGEGRVVLHAPPRQEPVVLEDEPEPRRPSHRPCHRADQGGDELEQRRLSNSEVSGNNRNPPRRHGEADVFQERFLPWAIDPTPLTTIRRVPREILSESRESLPQKVRAERVEGLRSGEPLRRGESGVRGAAKRRREDSDLGRT